MERIRGETFKNQDVTLDDRDYDGCTFENCALLYGGVGLLKLSNNSFSRCTLVFRGAAEQTLRFLQAMYAQPGVRPIIEQTFENIRNNATPSRQKPGTS